jgi:GNAT superfamily N-acetyltransferase
VTEVEQVQTRPVGPDDFDRFGRLWQRLSPETVYRRFLAPIRRLSAALVRHIVEVDHELREALVAVVDDEIVGIAQYERPRDDPSRADFAVLVQDDWQGIGLGTRLSDEIVSLAAARGVRTVVADVLASNDRMLAILRHNGPALHLHRESSVYEVELSLAEPPTLAAA